jgi:Tfp pilus assembly protein PilZ
MQSKECLEETVFSFSERTPEPSDRRGGARHMTILRVGSLVGPHGRELCLIRNISAGGVMAHVYAQHAPGEDVAIEIRTDEEIAGRIAWANGSNVGVQFVAPIDVEQMLTNQPTDDGRRQRMPRIEVDRLATVRAGAKLYGVNTCDISQGGVKVETDDPLPVGEDVVIAMERFRALPGVVRWSREGLAGISFNQVIPFKELMAWIRPERAQG